MNFALTNTGGLPPITRFDAYAAAVFALPTLSEAEEMSLAREVKENSNKEAAWKLSMAFLRLPVKIAREHAGYGVPLEDLAQEGNIGLLKAIRRFDPDRGARLAVVAAIWIKAEIRAYIIKNWRIVKTITTKKMRHLFFSFRKYRNELEGLGHTGTEMQRLLAEKIGCNLSELSDIEARLSGEVVLDDALDIADGHNLVAIEVESDDGFSNTKIGQLSSIDQEALIKNAVSALPERVQRVILARRMESPPVTLSALANELKVSVGRVHQLEQRGLALMKKQLFA